MKTNDDGEGGVKGETLFFFLRRDEVVQERKGSLLTKSNSKGKEVKLFTTCSLIQQEI
jgi:hypothetical protein